MTLMVEYAKRILQAEKLIKQGCKWPIVQELLQLRPVDAQRLAHEHSRERSFLSRIEKGMYWWRAPGKYNIRMVHANYMYYIYTLYSNKSQQVEATTLLKTYLTYCDSIVIPVIDNINRAYYLLNSIKRNVGFVFRDCRLCQYTYVAIGLLESDSCFSCERNQYMRCIDCQTGLDNPYNPGTNGNKKKRCKKCTMALRKKQRVLKRLQKTCYMDEHKLY